jgi:replicative superfamily II helicase
VHGQSKEAKAAQPPPERRGFSWTESDYEAMVSGLRAGQSLYKISKALERTGGAVLSRVEHLLPDPIPLDIPGDRDAQLEYLRRLLVEDKDYQWFELAQLRAHRDGRIVWTTDDDRRLRDAWDKGQPTLAELAQSFNTRPSFVAKHIVELTEASNNAEVEARLGDSSAASIPEPIQSVSPETVTPTTTPGRGSTGIANPEVVDSYSAGTGTEGALYRSLVDCFATAQQRLWIKVPWWDTSPAASRLIDEAIAARRRGVDVVVVSRRVQSNAAAHGRLRDAEIQVVEVSNLHEKVVIADDQVLSHSANFARKELEVNQNSGLSVTSGDAVDAFVAGFEKMRDDEATFVIGEEKWTPTSDLVPPELIRFINRDKLNPLQSKAVPPVLSTRGHIMVVAPTGAGKTLIGEIAALRSIVMDKQPAVWLVPARALAAEVAQTVKRWRALGVSAVELTGETNFSSETVRRAQLWVATTEKFESLYRRSSLQSFLDTVGCLIVDEVHLVGDPSRGSTLESLIARIRTVESGTRIVALSATAANAQELADWFNATKIQTDWRPVQLTTQLIPYDDARDESEYSRHNQNARDAAIRKLVGDIAAAESADGSPGSMLVFCGSKNNVKRTAALIADSDLHGDDQSLVEALLRKKIGIHYSGAPQARHTLDKFEAREILTLVATSGLSTGVNTPARHVVVRDLVLGFDSELEVSQAQQMLGRAGRLGHETHGYGYILVPKSAETAWRNKLDAGYHVRSGLDDKISDAILAEILLSSITSRDDARIWYRGTFAHAQSNRPHNVDKVIDELTAHGFTAEDDGRLCATELGALTARLMIDVEAATNLLSELASLPIPASATRAEEVLLRLIATSVPEFVEWPVNPKAYKNWVDSVLGSTGSLSSLGPNFGARFVAAAAVAAIRNPKRLHVANKGMSRAEVARPVQALPRYLSWIAGIGRIGKSTWEPAVAADLAQRLTWYELNPHPKRGHGRLLWFLEQLVAPEDRADKLPGLWGRARNKGFEGPDRLRTAPHGVDGNSFAQALGRRAHLCLAVPDGLTVGLTAAPADARMRIVTNCGPKHTAETTQGVTDQLDLKVPLAANREVAADVVVYATRGDFAYQNLTAEVPARRAFDADAATGLARQLIADLEPLPLVVDSPTGIRRLRERNATRTRREILARIAPDPQLLPIARIISSESHDPEEKIRNMRLCLHKLLGLRSGKSNDLRSPASILKSGTANRPEFEYTLLSLAASLGFTTGTAITSSQQIGLVEINGQWRTVTPIDHNKNNRLTPQIPGKLTGTPRPLGAASTPVGTPARPLFPWLAEFAPDATDPPASVGVLHDTSTASVVLGEEFPSVVAEEANAAKGAEDDSSIPDSDDWEEDDWEEEELAKEEASFLAEVQAERWGFWESDGDYDEDYGWPYSDSDGDDDYSDPDW